MSSRLNQEREERLQPKRIEVAIKSISDLGIVIIRRDNTKIQFFWKEELITFFPYSGWASGKTINDGRGLKNLLNQLKQK